MSVDQATLAALKSMPVEVWRLNRYGTLMRRKPTDQCTGIECCWVQDDCGQHLPVPPEEGGGWHWEPVARDMEAYGRAVQCVNATPALIEELETLRQQLVEARAEIERLSLVTPQQDGRTYLEFKVQLPITPGWQWCCSEQVRQVPMPVCTRGKIPLYYCIVGLYWRHGNNPFIACGSTAPRYLGTTGFSCKGTTNG